MSATEPKPEFADKTHELRLRDAIRKDIKAVASIYPTAFDLYDEPLERLVLRLAETFRKEKDQ